MTFQKYLINYKRKNRLTRKQLADKIPGATEAAIKRWLDGSREPKEYAVVGIKQYLE